MSRISNLRHALRGTLLASLALSVAACGSGGDQESSGEMPAPSADSSVPSAGTIVPDAKSLQNEFNALQVRLNGLQQQVMEDSTIAAQFAELQHSIDEAADKMDPALPAARQRMEELDEELAAAEQAGDQTKMQELLQEGMNLQTKLRDTQTKVMREEEMFAKMQAFQEKVVAAMTKIDPETPTLIARVTEIAKMATPPSGAPSGTPPPGASPPGGE